MRKIIKITLISLLVFILIVLAFGPMVMVNQLEKNSKEWVGRRLSIGDFSLNYFTGTVEIDSFIMYEADDTTTFISFDTLRIDSEPYRLFSNELVIEEFALIGLRTYITQHDTVFNFDDLIAFYSSNNDSLETAEEPSDTLSEDDPMVIKVSNIHLYAKELSYTAMILQHETKLVNLNIIIPYISWNTDGGSKAGVEFDLADNGHFAIDLDYKPDSNDFSADFKVSNLNLSSYYVFAELSLNISALRGMFDTHLLINGNLNEIEKTKVAGSMRLCNFAIDDLNNQKLIGLETLDIGIESIDAYNQKYVIDSVRIFKPYLDFELLENGNNFDYLVKEDTNKIKEPKIVQEDIDTAKKELYYSVGSFIMDDGVIEFKDHTTPRLFTYHLSKINMSTKEVTSTADWVVTHLDMLLNNRGNMKVELGFNPMKPKDMDIDYVLTNFLLSDINIYSEMNTGYPFVYGEMFYYSQTSIRDGQIKSENKLRINDVELGEKVKGWKSIPIKFALFLLKDKNGDVVMDVPVRGDLNDPDVNIKKLAWTTFKKAIFKVASSPVDFLAGFAKIDPNDIKSIEFAYTDTTLSGHIQHQLDMLLKLEEAKPGLQIKMAYFNDIEREKTAISVNEIGKRFNETQQLNYLKDEKQFKEYLQSKTLKDSVDIENDCSVLFGKHSMDSLYAIYSQKRFHKIENYLHQRNDSTQIGIQPYSASSPKNEGSPPIFELKYSVEDE